MSGERTLRLVHSAELAEILDWPSVNQAVEESYRQAGLDGWVLSIGRCGRLFR